LVGLCVGGGYWLGRHTQGFKLPWEKSGEKPLEKPSQLVPQQLILPKGMADFEQRVMLAANKALPAVVNINTEKKVRFQPSPSPFFNDPFFRRFFGDQIPYFAPQEQIQRSLGSGVIVTQDGYILTNHHVIAGADVIKVSLIDKRVFDARVVGLDPKTDLALLKIDATDLPLLPLGDSSKLEVGQFVLAVGNPFGLSGTVTMGIVSAKGRANIRIADYEDFIQTDAPINPGNSGGALVNLDGELVGINTVIFSQSGGNIGIGFAIPSNMAKGVMYNLIEYGRVVRGWLGVAIQDQADGKGVIVQGVMPNSPAEKAGLKQGDIILSYRGESIESGSELKNLVGETAPGEKVEIKILRSGTEMTISVVIAELKEEEIPELSVMNKLGIRVEELKKELREQFGIPDEIKEGVVVIAVDEAGRAGEAGVEPGDVILRANQTLVRRLSDLEKALESAGDDQIILWVWRTPRTITLVIPPKE
jgi:serine protease Do